MNMKNLKKVLCLALSAFVLLGEAGSVTTMAEESGKALESVTEVTEEATEQGTESVEEVTEEATEQETESVAEVTEKEAEQKTEAVTEEVIEQETEITAEEVAETETDEIETVQLSTNEIKNSAVNIGLNKIRTYALDSSSAENWYKFTISEIGYFQVYLNYNENTDIDEVGDGWTALIYSEADLSNPFYTLNSKDLTTSPKFPMGKGTYYVKVKQNWGYNNLAGLKYDIRANFTAEDNWESEPNDTNLTPQGINVNTLYKGTLYSSNDVDYYQFKISKDGYFKLTFDTSEADNDGISDGWDVSIYKKGESSPIRTYTMTSSVTQQALPYAKGTYYVRVSAHSYSNTYYAPTNQVYKFKIIFKENANWEKEGNDSSSTATAINLNTNYKGIITTSGDEDWYKFSVPAKGVIKLKFSKDDSANIEDIDDGWNVQIYNKSNNELVAEKKQVTSSASISATLKKGTYYIRVSAYYNNTYYAPIDCIYNMKVSYATTPVKPASVKATAGKASVKVSWKKTSNATGYVVYRSTSKSGKYTKVATLKDAGKVSYTDKKAKKGKKYFYKVKAYNNANGVTAYSSYSATVNAKAK